MMSFDLPPERRGERQQAALVHVETAVLVAADDVEGEGWAVPGRVLVRHQQLEDGAPDGLALLQENTCCIILDTSFKPRRVPHC